MNGRPAPVRGRRAFAELGKSRCRAASGAVRVHFAAADEGDPIPRVAFSVSRKVGGAVVRNRWRRRLRAIAAIASRDLVPGTYLIILGSDVNGTPFGDLERRVVDAMRRASAVRA